MVGWMLLYGYFLWLAVLPKVGCGPDGDQLYKILLGMSVLTLGAAAAIHATRRLEEVQSALRWLVVPLVLLAPWLAISIWDVFIAVNINNVAICGPEPPAAWQHIWAPAQALVVMAVAYSTWRIWSAAA